MAMLKADPMGPKEVADFLAVKRATVQQWLFRKVLPNRDFTVSGFPAWEKETIVRWALETGRMERDDPRVRETFTDAQIDKIMKAAV